MSGRQLLDWMAYAELEPFGEERADLRLASVLRMLFAINRDTEKHPNVPSLGEFYGSFLVELRELLAPEEKPPGIAKQSWQVQKALLIEHAVRAALIHEAEQQRDAKRKRRA